MREIYVCAHACVRRASSVPAENTSRKTDVFLSPVTERSGGWIPCYDHSHCTIQSTNRMELCGIL
jgi:hypothetical protein